MEERDWESIFRGSVAEGGKLGSSLGFQIGEPRKWNEGNLFKGMTSILSTYKLLSTDALLGSTGGGTDVNFPGVEDD